MATLFEYDDAFLITSRDELAKAIHEETCEGLTWEVHVQYRGYECFNLADVVIKAATPVQIRKVQQYGLHAGGESPSLTSVDVTSIVKDGGTAFRREVTIIRSVDGGWEEIHEVHPKSQ